MINYDLPNRQTINIKTRLGAEKWPVYPHTSSLPPLESYVSGIGEMKRQNLGGHTAGNMQELPDCCTPLGLENHTNYRWDWDK